MNPIQILATLRKFANYIAGIFPFLAVIADRVFARIRKLADVPWISPIAKRAGESPFLLAIWKFFERFYWRDYAKDRMEFGTAPAETMHVLRVVIQMCVVLSIVIPLSQFQIFPVEIESFSGYKHTVSSWLIVLWMLALPCAWATLLVGTAVCNRVSFALIALGALYFLSTCVIQLPRSFFNGFLTLAVLFSLIYCERSLKGDGKRNVIPGWINALVVGIAAGCQFTILTPLRPWLGTIFSLPGPVLSFGFGGALGAVVGAVCLGLSRKQTPRLLTQTLTSNLSMGGTVLIVTVSLLIFLIAGASRGGLAQSGGLILSSLELSNAYLWPILYFVGVGVIHKLLGSSKIIAASATAMVPPKLLIPLMSCMLAAATLCALSETVCGYLALQNSQIGSLAFNAFLPIYSFTKTIIWRDPLLSISAHWMIWVLLFDIALTVTLALQKKLTGAAMSRLFFTTCLAALLIWEYVFQMASFARGPIHSIIMIWLFAVWLLWLMHTVGWNLSLRSSPLWPSKGRMAVYGGIITLIILQVHARAASHDFRIVNELFLTMFRGVIDVGLPYYLLIWVNRRIRTTSPPPVGLMLTTFAAGGVTSMLFNAGDKLAGSHWSIERFSKIVQTQLYNLQNLGNINFDLHLPGYWLFLKAAIFVGLLTWIRQFAKQSDGPEPILQNAPSTSAKEDPASKEYGPAPTEHDNADGSTPTEHGSAPNADVAQADASRRLKAYLMVAFASGVVSFSYTLVDLPLPNELRIALAPLHQELLFNCNVLLTYLAYWIPALLLSGVILRTDRSADIVRATILAVLTNGAIMFFYQNFEVLLRATGLLYPAMVFLIALFVILLHRTLALLETSRCPEANSPQQLTPTLPADALLSYRSSKYLCLAAALAYAAISILQTGWKSFKELPAPTVNHSILLASDWTFKSTTPPAPPLPALSAFSRTTAEGTSTLQVSSMKSDPAGVKHHLKLWIDFLHLKVIKLEPWDRYYPGAYACTFSCVDTSSVTMAGLSVFVPRDNGQTETYTLSAIPSSFDQAFWEVALLVQRLRQ